MLSHSAHVSHLKVGGAPASFKAFYAVSLSREAPYYVPPTSVLSLQTAKGLRKPDPDYDRQEFTATPNERVRLRCRRVLAVVLNFYRSSSSPSSGPIRP